MVTTVDSALNGTAVMGYLPYLRLQRADSKEHRTNKGVDLKQSHLLLVGVSGKDQWGRLVSAPDHRNLGKYIYNNTYSFKILIAG